MRKNMIMSLGIIGSLLIKAYLLVAVLAFVTAVGRITERVLDDPTIKSIRNPASLLASLYRKLRKLSMA
jgi:hypothetical protein